jgi:hypothetical protein
MNNTELYPCRFCGSAPIAIDGEGLNGWNAKIFCENCEQEANHNNAWNARNEKHNPFIEEKV